MFGYLPRLKSHPLETPPPPRGEPSPWPRKHRKYQAPKAPKLIYTVILWYRFVVQSPPPPPPRGGGPSLCDRPPLPPEGGDRPDKRGEISRGGGYVGWELGEGNATITCYGGLR